MGPIWGRQDPGGPHVGPMNLAIWVILLSEQQTIRQAGDGKTRAFITFEMQTRLPGFIFGINSLVLIFA